MTVPTAVLGLGNELFTDEGLGVAASRELSGLVDDDIDVIDGGTLGLDLVPLLADRDNLLVLDAVAEAGSRPGDVVVLDDQAVRSSRRLLFSAHQIGLTEALAAADLWGRGPRRVAAVGMVPLSLDTGYGLSPEVEKRLSVMVARALDILGTWGVAVSPHA